MKTKLYLDTRATGGGNAPLKVGISHNGKTAYIALDVRLMPTDFEQDKKGWRIVNRADKDIIGNYVRTRVYAIEKVIYDAKMNGDLNGLDAIGVRDFVVDKLTPKEEPKAYFLSYFRDFNDTLHTGRTHEIYEATIKRILEFQPKAEKLTFEDITPLWLHQFMAYMRTRQRDTHNPNGSNIHLRNIRAVVNHAIHRTHVTTNYPFDDYDIHYIETTKRALTVDVLRQLFATPVDAGLQRYLDMLKLMFFLRGINVVDLCLAKKADVVDGRLDYIRAKTHKHYSVKIEPEAQAIIDQYAGSGDYLLNIMDTNSDYRNFSRNMARRIKHIGEYRDAAGNLIQPFAFITGYYMRHSFATIQINDNHEDIYTVSKGLGHQYGIKTTAVYVDFDQARADEANRRLIDWVLYGKKPASIS